MPKRSHSWGLSPTEAIALQRQWSCYVELEDRFGPVKRVAGVDVGFEQNGSITRAAVVVLSFPGLELIDSSLIKQPTRYPYIPGLLSFRELPAVLDAFERLKRQPDMVLCDGQGIAHPRGFGIASHLGVYLDIPTIGVGKTRLCGTHDSVADEKGRWVPLRLVSKQGGLARERIIGAVLRSRKGVKPVYVSPGHRISLTSAVDWVLNCTGRYKLPETTRAAHHLASNLK